MDCTCSGGCMNEEGLGEYPPVPTNPFHNTDQLPDNGHTYTGNITNTTNSIIWNGPICTICYVPYTGGVHQCTENDLQRQIDRLQEMIDKLREAAGKTVLPPLRPTLPFKPPPTVSPYTRPDNTWTQDRTIFGCSCRPENGGSGICNCILGGPRITC